MSVYFKSKKDTKRFMSQSKKILKQYAKVSEKDLQRSILDYINALGGVAVKFNNFGFRKLDGGWIPPRELGISDILACYKGRFIAIEVKSTGKKASNTQMEFLIRVDRAGGIGLCTDNIDEVISLLDKL